MTDVDLIARLKKEADDLKRSVHDARRQERETAREAKKKARDAARKKAALERAGARASCNVRVEKARSAEKAKCRKKKPSKRRAKSPPVSQAPGAAVSLLPPPLPRKKVAKVKKIKRRALVAATARQRATATSAGAASVQASWEEKYDQPAAYVRPWIIKKTGAAGQMRVTWRKYSNAAGVAFIDADDDVIVVTDPNERKRALKLALPAIASVLEKRISLEKDRERAKELSARLNRVRAWIATQVPRATIRERQSSGKSLVLSAPGRPQKRRASEKPQAPEAEREKAKKIAASAGHVADRVAVLGVTRIGRRMLWGVRFQVPPMHVEDLGVDGKFEPVEAFPAPSSAMPEPSIPTRKVSRVRKASGGRLRASAKQRREFAKITHVEWSSEQNDTPKVYVGPWMSMSGVNGEALVGWPRHAKHPMVVFVAGRSGGARTILAKHLQDDERAKAIQVALPAIVSAIQKQYLTEPNPTRARELYARLKLASEMAGIPISPPIWRWQIANPDASASETRASSSDVRASAIVPDFEQRRAARAARLSKRAARLAEEGAAKIERARKMAGVIPFGQPIHVGHHSERQDERFRKKIHETFRSGYETTKAAERAARRASLAAESQAISSDDPMAIEKLRAKLADEEATHALHVKGNAIIRKYGADESGAVRAMLEIGIPPADVQQAMTHHFGPKPTGFFTQNSAANIRRIKDRIKYLSEHRSGAATPETIGEIEIFEEDNRTKMRFPGKPSDTIRARLKSSGFRWSPTTGTWQKMSSGQALYEARVIANAAAEEK